ncbi:hypothetical protein Tco_1209531 [Tanacetum coccineum]
MPLGAGVTFFGTRNRGIATTSRGNYAAGQAKVVKCYNYLGVGHMVKQCTQPKRPRNSPWYKEKLMLVESQEAGQILDEEQLAFIVDPGIAKVQVAQQIIPQNSAFQTKDLDAYDSDCNDISSAKAVLMANLLSCNSDVLSESHTPVRIESPSELPKVSLVNKSLKKLKYHLASFDKVVKKRTTSDAITACAWGFEHTKACFVTEIIPFLKVLKDTLNSFDKNLLDEITEVQTVFNHMEAAVDQCFVDKNAFEVQIKQLSIDNDQLLKQIMSQEIMHIVVNFVDILNVYKSCVDECNKCLELETELLKKKDLIKKDVFDKLLKSYSTLEKHCISLELTTQLNQEIFQKDNCNTPKLGRSGIWVGGGTS